MKRLSFFVAACAALLMSTAAAAAAPQSNAPTTSASAQPNAKALDLSRRYFKAMDMERMLLTLTDSMVGAMGGSMEKLSPEVRQALVEAMKESSAARYAVMEDRYTALYAAEFSEEELQGLVDFYESPIGRSVVAKNGRLAERVGELIKEMRPAMMVDFDNRFCAKLGEKPGCSGLVDK